MPVTTNGHKPLTPAEGRAIVAAAAKPRRPELRASHGMSDGWWGKRISEVRAETAQTGGNGAAVAVPVVAANVPGEAPPRARSSAKPARVVTSVAARRQRLLVAVMIVVAGLVAGAVGTLSYSLTQTLASAAGTGWHAYIVPVVLDGMYLCGAICLAIDAKYRPAWIAISIGVVASSATAWVAADDPAEVVDLELTARTLMAFTPLCLCLCVVFILHAYKVRR